MLKKLLMFLSISLLATGCGCTVVDPGNRGVKVTMGSVDSQLQGEGLVWHMPLVTDIKQVTVRQQKVDSNAACFSQDMQAVGIKLSVLYAVPESNVLTIFKEYSGDPMNSFAEPRIQEALKEITANYTAEGIAKNREEIKTKALISAREKIGGLVTIHDIVIENISLSSELAQAIEQKMVQEQEASKAKFLKQKAEIEAQTRVLQAEAEAKAISVTGRAIRENPGVIQLELAKRWNGVSPLVTGGNSGVLLPLELKGK